ncbi:MAG: TVP38/TMEM64 family protein [Planctomycetes bacterium]|nr:TVP38/TMEM64 family protein [Planctomycetota bacterium]
MDERNEIHAADASPDETPADESNGAKAGRNRRKLIALVLALLIGGGLYYYFRDVLTLDNLVERETQLDQLKRDRPILVYGGAVLLYVVVTGLSLPGAAFMSLLYGRFFGLVPGVILVSFSSTAGATMAFLLSRYFLRDAIQAKFGTRLARFNEALKREGAFYLFTLRLIPYVPFFAINVVMGLTPIRVWTFWWVSQLGMLAGTIVYINAGASLPSLRAIVEGGAADVLTLRLFFSFLILGIFPLLAKRVMGMLRSRSQEQESTP